MLDEDKLDFIRERGWYSVTRTGVLWRHDDEPGNYTLTTPEEAYQIECAARERAYCGTKPEPV